MLFNSQDFVFLFLPACLIVTYLTSFVAGRGAGKIALILCSLAFYAYWRVDHVWIILISIAVNWFGVRLAGKLARRGQRSLGVAALVSFNIIMIGAFKYLGLFAHTFTDLTGIGLTITALALPLGISFFSFQQIAYVVDYSRGGRQDDSLVDYSLAVLFFPHLIAGPLVKYRALIDQFSPEQPITSGDMVTMGDSRSNMPPVERITSAAGSSGLRLFRPSAEALAIGVTIFAIGLFKKVMFADNFAVYSDSVFMAVEAGSVLSTTDAWIGAISFFFQIYFDFSGYTDMAIGLALFFGVRLPVNFLSPYMACSIVEFWRRWHITLSSFLRDYVYISLGGNRRGLPRRYINLLLTMLIGGLWHGASWTFVVWGGLHGLYLVINQLYNGARKSFGAPVGFVERKFNHILTLAAVLFAWIFFRADSFGGAFNLINTMFGMSSDGGETIITYQNIASSLPGQFTRALSLSGLETFGPLTIWIVLTVVASGTVFLASNTYELFSDYHEAESEVPNSLRTRPLFNLRWSLNPLWLLFTAFILVVGLLSMTQVAQFIYFEF